MSPSQPNTVVVLDNGAGFIKAGTAGNRNPTTILPNLTFRPPSSKKHLFPTPNLLETLDTTSSTIRRPFDRGYLINPDLQAQIWAHTFTELKISPQTSSLLLTEPLFNLASIARVTDEIVFEEFGFRSLFVSDGASLVHLYEASRRPYDVVAKSGCSLVVDLGFSFGHCVPVVKDVTCNYGVKRLDLGGKVLTNYLKELVSYRSINVMDETFLMDDVKEKLCFVSNNFERDLNIARRRGNDNHFRCTYVLPDGITHTKGFVKDPIQAQKYLNLSEDGELPEGTNDADETEANSKPSERNKVDLTKNEFSLSNERFLVPEMIFRPADLGMNQAGLAECIVRAVNSCHPHLHPVLYESIILTGGSILFPGFSRRLESELRPLVPDMYQVKITSQEDPILGVWRGGSLLASSPDFDAMCVTKSEYEELGSYRCRRRFFH